MDNKTRNALLFSDAARWMYLKKVVRQAIINTNCLCCSTCEYVLIFDI